MTPVFLEEVPPANRGRVGRPPGQRVRFVELLKTHPGYWAQYQPGRRFSKANASVMVNDFPGVEATYRRRAEGGFDIYARWVG